MSDVELVIKLPEEDYQNLKAKDKFDDMYLNYYEKLIVHGTPLPNGHGRLIDGDAIEKFGKERMYQIGLGAWNMFDVVINNAPTIIEADKESEEEE